MAALPTALLTSGLLGGSVRAQGTVTLHVGAARALAGVETVGDDALYGVGGLTVDWVGDHARVVAGLQGGLAADEATGADFASGSGSVEIWSGSGTAVGVAARGSAFAVRDPFLYRTYAARVGPTARLRTGPWTIALRTEWGLGSSRVELRRGDRVRRANQGLWSRGGELEIEVGGARWRAGVVAGGWTSDGGDFAQGGGWAALGRGPVAVRIDAGAWNTPLGTEWTGGLAVVVSTGRRWSAAVSAARVPPDPLTLVEAGGQGGLLMAWDAVRFAAPPPPLATVHEEAGQRVARFRLRDAAAAEASTVELLGDFTNWDPVGMRREGSAWVADLPVAPGVHHYGFRVDGTWFVPAGRPGNVPDEWGRTNATLVVDELDEGGLP